MHQVSILPDLLVNVDLGGWVTEKRFRLEVLAQSQGVPFGLRRIATVEETEVC